jgi:hypothetical protein
MGEFIAPDAPNSLVITLQQDGSALVVRDDGDTLRTSFDTDGSRWRLTIRFDHPIPEIAGKEHIVPEIVEAGASPNSFLLSNGATNCDDCLEFSTFVRVP